MASRVLCVGRDALPMQRKLASRNHSAPGGGDPADSIGVMDLERALRNVGPDGFATMIAAETEKWAKVIRAANIKGD